MASAQARRGADWDKLLIDRAIAEFARRGVAFSSNDLRAVLPSVDGQLLGARFRAASQRRQIETVGIDRARHASGHGRTVLLWIGRRP